MKKVVVEFVTREDNTEVVTATLMNTPFPCGLGVRAIHIEDVEEPDLPPYDGPEATNDDPEHLSSLADQVSQNRINALAKTILQKESFHNVMDDEISQKVRVEAKLILGYNRPSHENDAEYYGLCDAIFHRAVRRIHVVFNMQEGAKHGPFYRPA